jgi:hypothetical protein
MLDNLHIHVLNFTFIPYVYIVAGETSTMIYLHPSTQSKIQSKLKRFGKRKVK